MPKALLPELCAVVLDGDAPVARAVHNRIEANAQFLKVMSFSSPVKARKSLESQKHFEPVILITDSIGVNPYNGSLAEEFSNRFPRASIVLFSGSLPKNKAKALVTESRIRAYVPKGESLDVLVAKATKFIASYQQEKVLKSMRIFLNECESPRLKFMSMGDKEYSMIDVYWEVLRKTEIGKLLEGSWLSLMRISARKKLSNSWCK